MRRAAMLTASVLVAFVFAGPAAAAAPDGVAGPWADYVVDFQQGDRLNGTDVLPGRSDPNDALGPAESPAKPSDTPIPEGTFVSLGFGGSLILGFENPICNGAGPDVGVIEITLEPYPNETVEVWVSESAAGPYVLAGTITKDGSVPMPIPVAHFVKLIDVSNPDDFAGIPDADGFDVDGVRALDTTSCERLGNEGCTPGFWKQTHHYDSWPSGIAPTDLFSETFGVAFGGTTLTLAGALELTGPAANQLAKQAVAALLNALSPDVDYAYTSAQVISMVQTALASGSTATINNTKDLFDAANNAGCPLT